MRNHPFMLFVMSFFINCKLEAATLRTKNDESLNIKVSESLVLLRAK